IKHSAQHYLSAIEHKQFKFIERRVTKNVLSFFQNYEKNRFFLSLTAERDARSKLTNLMNFRIEEAVIQSGAEGWKVDERPGAAAAILVAEFEAYPEPKALLPVELEDLTRWYGGFAQAARAIGDISEGFIRQNIERSDDLS